MPHSRALRSRSSSFSDDPTLMQMAEETEWIPIAWTLLTYRLGDLLVVSPITRVLRSRGRVRNVPIFQPISYVVQFICIVQLRGSQYILFDYWLSHGRVASRSLWSYASSLEPERNSFLHPSRKGDGPRILKIKLRTHNWRTVWRAYYRSSLSVPRSCSSTRCSIARRSRA
jgi:hypothetical protein